MNPSWVSLLLVLLDVGDFVLKAVILAVQFVYATRIYAKVLVSLLPLVSFIVGDCSILTTMIENN